MSEYERGRRDGEEELLSELKQLPAAQNPYHASNGVRELIASIESSLAATSGTPAPAMSPREQRAMQFALESGKSVHASDCATSCAPAEEPGPCDCDVPQPADETLPVGARSAYAAFDAAVKFMQANGYSDWDGTADGSEITRTGCANMMARYLAAAREPAAPQNWKARYEVEYAIVDRVWCALGITDYAGAGGKAIDELVKEAVKDADLWRKQQAGALGPAAPASGTEGRGK